MNAPDREGPKSIAQHYVPQFYLRRFTDSEGRLRVFDKERGGRFTTGTAVVAFENRFYDLDPAAYAEGEVDEFNDKDLGERAMRRFDEELDAAIKDLLAKGPTRGIEPSIRHRLGFGMATQFLRTRAFREQIRMQAESLVGDLLRSFMRLNFPEADPNSITGLMAKGALGGLHLQTLFDPERWIAVGRGLESHIWFLAINSTSLSFVTSDNPISRRAHLKGKMANGFQSPGIQIVYTLDPKHALIMYDRQFHASLIGRDGRAMTVDRDTVVDTNEIVAANSEKFIFGADEALDELDQFFSANPDLRQGRWDRWRTVSDEPRPVTEDGEQRLKQTTEQFIDPVPIKWSGKSI